MSRRTIELHITRLVLDSVPLAGAEVPRLQAALEQELRALLAAAPAEGWTGGALARLDVQPVHLAPGDSAQVWGREIARTVYAGIGRAAGLGSGPQSPGHGAFESAAGGLGAPGVSRQAETALEDR
jgi:hypothetical protein